MGLAPLISLLCTLLASFRVANGSVSVEDVVQFCSDNGHRQVNLFYDFDLPSMKWFAAFKSRDIFFSINSFEVSKTKKTKFSIFIYETKRGNMKELLGVLSQTNVKQSLIIIDDPEQDMNEMRRLLTEMDLDTFFFLAAPGQEESEKMSWHQVISLSSGIVIDKINFHLNNLLISEEFNLNGLRVTSTTLSWPPFYTVDNCDQDNFKCATGDGYLGDYMDMLARRYNFTYISYKDPNDDWGTVVKEGPQNLSGTWGGVMGDVINKKYDMSISAYWWTSARSSVLQFVPVTKDRNMLALTPQKSTDTDLFIRCFTDYSWIAISITVGVIMACIVLQKYIMPDEYTNAETIMTFTVWLFFVMINAFYGGALTMFFTGTTDIPFNSRHDVLREYPDWKYKFMDGLEARIYHEVMQGDAEHKAFWEMFLKDKIGTTFTDIKEGLKFISLGQNAIEVNEAQLFQHLTSYPTEQKLYFFGHSHWEYFCLIFPLNSPLVPIFRQGANYIRERGMEQQLHHKWIGHWKGSGGSLMDTTVLTGGQTMMIFITLMGTFGLTLLLLCGEKIVMKISKNLKQPRQSTVMVVTV